MFKQMRQFLPVLVLSLLLVACGQQASPPTTTGAEPETSQTTMPTETTMGGMDHSSMPMASGDVPYDAQFIDSMIEHHEGAIQMAEQALQEAERQEIRDLAHAIISDQQREIEQMQAWREAWFPDLPMTSGMGMEMGDMEISADQDQPFEQRFIAAMIAHHNGAIAMARDAIANAERDEIKQLAQAIVQAQEAEVAQLAAWNQEWFGGQ
jgi:uncharacterized protein (DUF305 family)